jgi:tRNA nucleotidyltransferase/poly(A) polymerase
MFPTGHKYSGIADFVMARKEIGYVEGTRTPIVKPGTLYDDLERRDFTVNAMAKGEDGEIIDFFNGKQDLKDKILKTPLECEVTFNDDPLRILRAIRFSITKGFKITAHMAIVMDRYPYTERMGVVSDERIKDELLMCFKHDTFETMRVLNEFPTLRGYIFTKTKIWLKPTMNHEN